MTAKKLAGICFVAIIAAVLTSCDGIQPAKESDSMPPVQTTPAVSTPAPTTAAPPLEPKAVKLALKAPQTVDADGDGQEDVLVLLEGHDEETWQDTVLLDVDCGGGKRITEVVAGWFCSAYLYTDATGAGVVVSTDLASDDYVTAVYRLGAESLVKTCEIYGYAADMAGRAVTVNGSVDVLGTWGTRCAFVLSEAFALEPSGDGLYHIVDSGGDRTLEVSRELPVEMLQEDGTYTAATLAPGTEMRPVATDGESFVLFTLADGSEGRLSFTMGEYETAMIQGQEEAEWFRELMYAG